MKARELLPPSVAGVLLLLAHLLPAPQNAQIAGIPTICPLKILTTIPCPGCGLTRSLVFFAHGDWIQAFSFHPLGPLVYVALWLAIIAGVLPTRRQARILTPRSLMFAGSTFGACLLIVWIVRLSGLLPYPSHF